MPLLFNESYCLLFKTFLVTHLKIISEICETTKKQDKIKMFQYAEKKKEKKKN